MTTAEIYRLLFEGGNYAKPYLIKLYHPTAGTLRLVNNNEEVQYAGETYRISNFKYTPPTNKGDGGSLEISSIDNEDLFAFIENADDTYQMSVVGIIDTKTGEIQKIKTYRHFYGSVSMGEDWSISFSLGRDDRLDMKFNPYVYDTDSNRGNA